MMIGLDTALHGLGQSDYTMSEVTYDTTGYLCPGCAVDPIGGGSYGWGDFLKWAENTAGKVIGAQFGQPQLPPGTVITTPSGQIIRQNPGYPVTPGPVAAQVGGSSFSTIVLLSGLALVAVLALRRK